MWPIMSPRRRGVWLRALPQHRFDAKGVIAVFRVREFTENQPRDLIKHPRQPKLGKHAIDAVGRFIIVFEEKNLVLETWQIRRCEQARDEGQIATQSTPSATPG